MTKAPVAMDGRLDPQGGNFPLEPVDGWDGRLQFTGGFL